VELALSSAFSAFATAVSSADCAEGEFSCAKLLCAVSNSRERLRNGRRDRCFILLMISNALAKTKHIIRYLKVG
jgi:hypothetical protein